MNDKDFNTFMNVCFLFLGLLMLGFGAAILAPQGHSMAFGFGVPMISQGVFLMYAVVNKE